MERLGGIISAHTDLFQFDCETRNFGYVNHV